MRKDTGIRKSPYEEGIYFVQDHAWHVGKRYTLQKLLGSGSFSSVCLATDQLTGEQVALKRIPNVTSDTEQAKRVLREVCILRRLNHPNIISLKDAFVTPADTGPCKLINGKLVQLSLDLYLALEFCEGGDMFEMRGQLAANEVKWLLWQTLQAVRYLHERNVWHRDLKSANILMTLQHGQRIVKLGDFGSARSSSTLPCVQGGARAGLTHVDSMMDVDDALNIQRVPQRIASKLQSPSAYARPLTRCVATPCYRAPEVVISRGGYSSAIDMWSVGCIFGELLQRMSRVGSAATPNLTVAPLIAVSGMPKTPATGETYESGPSSSSSRKELSAVFDVIGTPAWACIEAVQMVAWRNFLRKLAGRAPTLYRRFSYAGEVAVDLLTRLLAFDPARRCSAEEALAHEYLTDVPSMVEDSASEMVSEIEALARAASITTLESDNNSGSGGGGVDDDDVGMVDSEDNINSNAPGAACFIGSCYNEEEVTARALSLLEDDLLVLSWLPKEEACERLQLLLEREVQEVQDLHQAKAAGVQLAKLRPPSPTLKHKLHLPKTKGSLEELLDKNTSLRLQIDTGNLSGVADLGRQRLSNVADACQVSLDPEKYLGPKRHGEWTRQSGAGTRPGPSWGVSVIPPGLEDNAPDDPAMQQVIRGQQVR